MHCGELPRLNGSIFSGGASVPAMLNIVNMGDEDGFISDLRCPYQKRGNMPEKAVRTFEHTLPNVNRKWDSSLDGEGLFLIDERYICLDADQRVQTIDLANELVNYAADENSPVRTQAAMIGSVYFGQKNGIPFVQAGGYNIGKSDADKPRWCIVRTKKWELVRHIEAIGIPCFPSSETIRITKDKGLSFSFASELGIPQPDALLTTPMNLYAADVEYPVVMKRLDSNKGSNVFYISDEFGLYRYGEMLEKDDYILLQKAMPTGDDMRVQVICGKIYDVLLRHQSEKDFRSNLDFGGKAEGGTLTAEEEKIVHRIVEGLPDGAGRSGFICVDFLFDENGNAVLGELNAMPGIKRLHDTDPVKFNAIVDFYISQIRSVLDGEQDCS